MEFKGREAEISVTPEELFLKRVEFVQQKLKEEGVDFRIVGSCAIWAHLCHDSESNNREFPLPRDLDILCLSAPNHKIIKDLQQVFDDQFHKSGEARVDLGYRPPIKNGQDVKRTLLPTNMLSNVGMTEDKGYLLIYNNEKLVLDERIMEKVIIDVGGIGVETLPAETILHLYLTRGGVLKPKDPPKLKKFARYISEQHKNGKGLPHSLLQPFHDFADKIVKIHPLNVGLYRLVCTVDKKTGGAISKLFYVAKVVRKAVS